MELEQPTSAHQHCENCFFLKCKLPLGSKDGCPLVQCPNSCGAKHHECKAEEHVLLCPVEKVPCINEGNGCPIRMARWKLGSHLQTCPASVLHCTMEWNRWPVYSRERKARVPFTQENFYARYGQLDVALALRDQRMLNNAMKAPRKTLRSLRNPLTQRFPAVPFVPKNSEPDFDENYESQNTSRTVSDDDSDAPWEVAKDPPGLQRSVCSELFKATKKTTESLTAALSILTSIQEGDNGNNGEVPVVEDAAEKQLAQASAEIVKDKDSADEPSNSENAQARIESKINSETYINDEITALHIDIPSTEINVLTATPVPPAPPPSLTLKNILGLDLNLESITRYQQKPKSMYTFLCAQCFRRDQYQWHFLNTHCDIHGGLNGWMEQRCPLAHYGCTYSLRRFHPHQEGATVVFNPMQESYGVRMLPNTYKNSKDKSTNHIQCEEHNDGDKYREYVTKAKKKEPTPEIYTSIDCDSIIQVQGNLHRQNSPIKSHSLSPTEVTNYGLADLPFEVLRIIFLYLDSFSLSNMAVASRLMRQVCSSILEERGIVVQEWLSKQIDGKNQWYIGYKRWFFSSAFSPVTKWGFEKNPPMAEHLKTCPFYMREQKVEPFDLGMVCITQADDVDYHHSPGFWDTMEKMYPGQDIRGKEQERRDRQKIILDLEQEKIRQIVEEVAKYTQEPEPEEFHVEKDSGPANPLLDFFS